MAAAAERAPLIGSWRGAGQVRRWRPNAREWARRSWCGWSAAGAGEEQKRRAALCRVPDPKQMGNPGQRFPRLDQRNRTPRLIVPTVGGAVPPRSPAPGHPENWPLRGPLDADLGAAGAASLRPARVRCVPAVFSLI